jgi:hypothetical protein
MEPIQIAALVSLGGSYIASSQPSLTIHNADFGILRDRVALDLKKGENAVTYAGATQYLEPDSVVLHDPRKRTDLRILEQSYRAEVLSQGLLLSQNEGRELGFTNRNKDWQSIIRGKVIRSSYAPKVSYRAEPPASTIIEVGGNPQFSLPTEPRFPTSVA